MTHGEYRAMSKTRMKVNFSPTCCCSESLLLKSVARKCCSNCVSLCLMARSLMCHTQNGASKCTTQPDTAQTETERVLTKPDDTSSPRQPSVSSQGREKSATHHPCIDHLILRCLHSCCVQLIMVQFGFTLRAEKAHPHYMVGQPKNRISDLHFETCPTPSTVPYWRTSFKHRSVFWF